MWSKQKLRFIAIRCQQYLKKQAAHSQLPDVLLLDIMSFLALALQIGLDLGDKDKTTDLGLNSFLVPP